MLQINHLTITTKRDMRTILEDFTFSLNPGDRAAIIGEEGNGKSTLLKLIYNAGLIEPYAEWQGEIFTGGARLGYLAQELAADTPQETAWSFLTRQDVFSAADYDEILSILRTLGLPADALYSEQPVSTMSGGEKIKLQLAAVLMGKPDMLLLDEPTNDIDIDTLEWLEGFLQHTPLPLLYVSHDETLIENTANVVIHLEQVRKKTVCRHTIFRGTYTAYMDARGRALAHTEQIARKEQADYDKQLARWRQIYEKVDHQQASISRADPAGGRLLKKKMKSVKAQGRRFERERDNFTQRPDTEAAIFLSFPDCAIPNGKEILTLELPVLSAGTRTLATDVVLRVTGPEHIGIIGKNGAGKTTLLQAAAKLLLPRRDIRAAYMPQDYGTLLPADISAVNFLAPSAAKAEVTRARTYLGSVRMTREEMDCPTAQLSGGQRAKLFLLKMALAGCDVLLLDEPTRNFSPLSNPVIRGILRDFGGAIISVSHDRKYLEEVCTVVYRLTPAGLVRL